MCEVLCVGVSSVVGSGSVCSAVCSGVCDVRSDVCYV